MKRGVYLISGGGYFKIGRTSNVDERIKALQLNVPFTLVLVAFGPVFRQEDLVKAELGLHKRFNHARVRPRSEWFNLTTEEVTLCIELLQFIQPPKMYGPREKPKPRIGSPEWALERLRVNDASSSIK